jgi:hypothetical protein
MYERQWRYRKNGPPLHGNTQQQLSEPVYDLAAKP